MVHGGHSGSLRRAGWLTALLLMAVLARGLVPQGWMPAARADGLALVICTAAGPVDAQSAIGTDGQPASNDLGADPVCSFAGTPQPAAPPPVLAAAWRAASWLAIAMPLGQMAEAPAPAPIRRPPSQGPPLR